MSCGNCFETLSCSKANAPSAFNRISSDKITTCTAEQRLNDDLFFHSKPLQVSSTANGPMNSASCNPYDPSLHNGNRQYPNGVIPSTSPVARDCHSPSTPQSSISGGSISTVSGSIAENLDYPVSEFPMESEMDIMLSQQHPRPVPYHSTCRPVSNQHPAADRYNSSQIQQQQQPITPYSSNSNAANSSLYVSPFLSVEGRPLPVPASQNTMYNHPRPLPPLPTPDMSLLNLANLQMLSANPQLLYTLSNVPFSTGYNMGSNCGTSLDNNFQQLLPQPLPPVNPTVPVLFGMQAGNCGNFDLQQRLFVPTAMPSNSAWNGGDYSNICSSSNIAQLDIQNSFRSLMDNRSLMNEVQCPYTIPVPHDIPCDPDTSMNLDECSRPSPIKPPPISTTTTATITTMPTTTVTSTASRKSRSLIPDTTTEARPMRPCKMTTTNPSNEQDEKVCAVCGKEATLECSTCAQLRERGYVLKSTFFCCAEHQKMVWKDHHAEISLEISAIELKNARFLHKHFVEFS